VHDKTAGKLTLYFFLKDLRTTFTVKDAPKLNLKTRDGNKQLELTGAEYKWEVTNDLLKEEPNGPKFAKTMLPRLVLVLDDGKKYNVNLDAHAGHNHD